MKTKEQKFLKGRAWLHITFIQSEVDHIVQQYILWPPSVLKRSVSVMNILEGFWGPQQKSLDGFYCNVFNVSLTIPIYLQKKIYHVPSLSKEYSALRKANAKKRKRKKKVKRMQTWEFFILQNNKTETFEGKIKILS